MKNFKGSFIATIIGLSCSAIIGYYYTKNFDGAISAILIASVLAVLEISLSFDNAIINASVIEKMTEVWRHRFLTWGMIIAVFFMRLVFPLLIVTFVAHINPIEALKLAIFNPDEYAKIMQSSHVSVAAFGGSFLSLVAMKYFFNDEKNEHWLKWIEVPLTKLGRLEAFEVAVSITTLLALKGFFHTNEQDTFLNSGLWGIITFILVDGISAMLEFSEKDYVDMHRASLGLFIYLEVLDASFSFDGVVGAFAITNNLFVIMIGLGIGAFFVRSLTLIFVEKKSLSQYIYIEHGAYYAIGALAVMMLTGPIFHTPEWITGLSGGLIILLSFLSSLRVRRN